MLSETANTDMLSLEPREGTMTILGCDGINYKHLKNKLVFLSLVYWEVYLKY